MQVTDTTPDDFLRLVGNEDNTPVHGVSIGVVRMQGLPYRANEEDIVRERRWGWVCGDMWELGGGVRSGGVMSGGGRGGGCVVICGSWEGV